MTKRDFQEKEYAEELRQDLWPEPPQENLFEDTSISALYLEKLAIAMFNQNIKGASYVEDIAYQLDSLGADYVRVVKSRDEAKTQANRFREDAAASARLMYTANSDCIDAQDECDKLRARVAHLEDANRAMKDAADAACDLLDESNARVAELEKERKAKGGGE